MARRLHGGRLQALGGLLGARRARPRQGRRLLAARRRSTASTTTGRIFSSHGYGNTAATPQGTPVLFQAGSSARGRRFGATHGECIFLSGSSVEELRGYVTVDPGPKRSEVGRDPQSLKTLAGVATVIAPTREAAQRKHQAILDCQSPERSPIASYAWFTGLDLSAYDPSTAMEDLHTELGQTQIARFKGQTVGEVLKAWHEHGVRGNAIVGSPEDVADELCALADGADLDGFLINPLIQPGTTSRLHRARAADPQAARRVPG